METERNFDYAKLCDARNTLCGFCKNDNCENCQVTKLLDDAYVEYTTLHYWEASIVQFDENNVPDTKVMVCIKANYEMPSEDDFKTYFEDIFDSCRGDEIRDIREISEEDAIEMYDEDTMYDLWVE